MRLFVEKDFFNDRVKIYGIIEKGGERDIFGLSSTIPGAYIIKRTTPGELMTGDDILPLFDFQKELWKDLVAAIFNHATEEGLKPEEQYRMEGEMKQKDEHIKTLKKAFDVLMNNTKK